VTQGVVALIKALLQEPGTAGYALDDPALTRLRVGLVRRKGFLRRLYAEWYRILNEPEETIPAGARVELGSGPGFLKEIIPGVITSDLMPAGNTDLVFSAGEMPFRAGSVAALYLVNVFHHLPQPRAFLREASRCLAPGGRIEMIEPFNTAWGRLVWRNLHHERFDLGAGWELAGTGPLSDANGALPWIIFVRDRATFEREYPLLRIVDLRPFMPFSYLVSGGVSLRSLLPGRAFPLVRGIERLMGPLERALGMFAVIRIRRTG
jgi:SAM-dependent methyltransferase